jgi:hypothetical protein
MNPRTVAALADLPTLVADLEVELVEATPEPSTSAGKPTSRPPLALPVVSDIDEAWGVVTTWARDWCETYTLTGPAGAWTWSSICLWLRLHYETTAEEHPAIDEFDDEIGDEYRKLRRHIHDRPKEWNYLPGRWTCPNDGCDGILRQQLAHRYVWCPGCGTRWDEVEYELLGRMLGQEYAVTVEQAAAWAKVDRRTVNRWIAHGYVPLVDPLSRLVDRRDIAAMMVRREA